MDRLAGNFGGCDGARRVNPALIIRYVPDARPATHTPRPTGTELARTLLAAIGP